MLFFISVDQNKGIWGSFNCQSTANQRVSIAELYVVSDTILRRDLSKHDCVSQPVVDMAWTRAYSGGLNNRGSTTNQSRISSTFAENWHGLAYEKLCCSDSSLAAITIEHRFQANSNVSPKTTCHGYHIGVSSYSSSWFSWLIQQMCGCLNREPIADQSRRFYNRGCWNTCLFIILKGAFTIVCSRPPIWRQIFRGKKLKWT